LALVEPAPRAPMARVDSFRRGLRFSVPSRQEEDTLETIARLLRLGAFLLVLVGVVAWSGFATAAPYKIILKDGQEITATGPYEVHGSVAVYRPAKGKLTSLPLEQIDVDATIATNAPPQPHEAPATSAASGRPTPIVMTVGEERPASPREEASVLAASVPALPVPPVSAPPVPAPTRVLDVPSTIPVPPKASSGGWDLLLMLGLLGAAGIAFYLQRKKRSTKGGISSAPMIPQPLEPPQKVEAFLDWSAAHPGEARPAAAPPLPPRSAPIITKQVLPPGIVMTEGTSVPLVSCPACGSQVSSQADACPKCGQPMRPPKVEAPAKWNSNGPAALLGILGVCIALFVPGGLIGGLIVMGLGLIVAAVGQSKR
jgi:zinc-ribbon domain